MNDQPLLILLRNALFDKKIESFPQTDLCKLLDEAEMQAVSIPVYSALKKNGILNSEEDALWRKRLTPKLAKNTRMLRLHAEVCRILDENGIKNCIIKGVASAAYYPDPYTRSLGDVDVFVEKADLKTAMERFKENGFTVKEDIGDNNHHVLLKKGVSSVEIHFELPGMPNNEMYDTVKALFKDLFEKSERFDTGFGEINVPSPVHHGAIILMHAYQHIKNEGIGLRHLSDWAVFSKKADRDELTEGLKRIGMRKFQAVLNGAANMLGADIGVELTEEEKELSHFIFNDIFKSGSFGAKDKERRESLAYSPKANDNKKSNQLKRYLDHAIKNTKILWPFFDRCKILLPVGFIMYCFRILFKVILGKTKIHSLKNAYTRAEYYNRLNWYKPE